MSILEITTFIETIIKIYLILSMPHFFDPIKATSYNHTNHKHINFLASHEVLELIDSIILQNTKHSKPQKHTATHQLTLPFNPSLIMAPIFPPP